MATNDQHTSGSRRAFLRGATAAAAGAAMLTLSEGVNPMTAAAEERGSDKLATGASCGSAPIDVAELEKLLGTIRQHGALIDYFPIGIPYPGDIVGSIQVRPELVGTLIQELVRFDKLRLRYDIFPYGIPDLDWLRIDFATPGARF